MSVSTRAHTKLPAVVVDAVSRLRGALPFALRGITCTTSSGIRFGYHQMCTCARLSTDMAVGARSSPSAPPDARRPRAGLGEILTLSEVAEYLKISMKTAYGMARSDDFPAFKAGKHWRVPRAELGAWVARRSQRSRGQTE